MTIRQGDLFANLPPSPFIIAHVCNDVGKWGKGFTHALDKWSMLPREKFKGQSPLPLSTTQFVRVDKGKYVMNMCAQHGTRSLANPVPLNYASLEACLLDVKDYALDLQATVLMPKIGSGLAMGDWDRILPLIETHLDGVDWEVWEKAE